MEKRYVASLQDVADRTCYKDFFESNKFEETRQKADDEAEKYQRSTVVFDRQHGIVYKKEVKRAGDEAIKVVKSVVKRTAKTAKPETAEPKPVKRGPKAEVKEFKPSSNDDYF